MNGIRFYEEFSNKRKGISEGNVVAALVSNGINAEGCYNALVSLTYEPNGAVCGSTVALDYLRAKCKRIAESKARAIHPALFARLDNE